MAGGDPNILGPTQRRSRALKGVGGGDFMATETGHRSYVLKRFQKECRSETMQQVGMASEVQRGQLGVWGGVTSYEKGHLGEPAIYVTMLLPKPSG